MVQNTISIPSYLPAWQRGLLTAAAVCTVLLISMGGILCVTQSIRNCPDWPGCFGRVIPPAETGPMLEYTHRVLAALSGLLILSAAITGLVKTSRSRWVTVPPLVAIPLVALVSFFGAQVVLYGLAPGWAAVDVGSALLVVALMVAAAVAAWVQVNNPVAAVRPVFRSFYSRLVLLTAGIVYALFVSGVLVAGKSSITACLGWPVYSARLGLVDGHAFGNTLRIILSVVGAGLVVGVVVLAWSKSFERPEIFRIARWVGLAFLLEAVVQALMLFFGYKTPLLVVYTVTAAIFWALLVALTIRTGLEQIQS